MGTDKISTRSMIEIGVNAALQLVPIAGSPISSVWSAIRQEKTNLRMERFLQGVIADVERLKSQGVTANTETPETVAKLVESAFEKVESEANEDKLGMFRRYIESTLRAPPTEDFDQRKTYLNELSSISMLECSVLAFFFQSKESVQIKNLSSPGVDVYAILGAINRLKGRGFVVARRGGFMMNGVNDESLEEIISLSDYGTKFAEYCLAD